MDMDLEWCPVCERAIVQPPEPQQNAAEPTPRPLSSSGSSAKLSKSRSGTIKGRKTAPDAAPATGSKLRRECSSGKNLAAKMGGLKVAAADQQNGEARAGGATRDGTIRRTGKRVQLLVDATKKDPAPEEDRPVQGARGELYCSEECRRFDEAQDSHWYHESRSSDSYDPHRHRPRLPSPQWPSHQTEGETENSPASDYYSSGAEGSGYDTRSRRYSSGVESSAGRRSNDSLSSLSNVEAETVPNAAASRLGGLRGLHAMTPIAAGSGAGGDQSPRLTARPMTGRSKSDDGTAAVGVPRVQGSAAQDGRQARSYDKGMPMRRPPLLFAPNGSPLVQASFPQRLHHHHPHHQHRKTLSTSPGSPANSILSPFSDSGASTAASYSSRVGASSDDKTTIYGDTAPPRRNPSSNSLTSNPAAQLSRSPGDFGMLSSSLGSFRNIHRPHASSTVADQFTPTPTAGGGVPFPGSYAWHPSAAHRPGSSSSLASARRDSSSSVRAKRPELLQAQSDSDTSSPPSSPGWPPLAHLPNPLLAGVRAEDAAYALKGQQNPQNRSWSWDHLPPYVPQYPAMDVDLVRRSRSGLIQTVKVPPRGHEHQHERERERKGTDPPSLGGGGSASSAKKKLFIFNQEE